MAIVPPRAAGGPPLIELILLSIAFAIFVGIRYAQDRRRHPRRP